MSIHQDSSQAKRIGTALEGFRVAGRAIFQMASRSFIERIEVKVEAAFRSI